MRAYIIVDLGFGDSGKGLLTDYFVRHFNAGVVIRYNGGAQAGHNVITSDGRHHTFSQFGSGTFIPHVKTYLSKYVVIHPSALLVEGDLLQKKGVPDPFSLIRINEQALVITPFHQATNRIRELVRGVERHGSCGVGVGEVVEDARTGRENHILASDLYDPPSLRSKLQKIRQLKREQILGLYKNDLSESLIAREYEIFQREDVIDTWISSISRIKELKLVVDDSTLEHWLQTTDTAIFEGAQGVLLDEEAGFHPHTTWSQCTATNAYKIIHELAPGSPEFQIGVMRAYAMRHGPGPLPTETDTLKDYVTDHNKFNEWQGAVRYGWFDAVLARYALCLTGEVNSFVVTHIDILDRIKSWKYCQGYKEYQGIPGKDIDISISNGLLTDFRVSSQISYDQKAQFTRALSKVLAEFNMCEAKEENVIQKIETLLGIQVGIVSYGPTANNVQIINPLPS